MYSRSPNDRICQWIHIYMGSIKLKLASKTKNFFYSSNMYLTYLES